MTLKFNALVPPFDLTLGTAEGEGKYVTLGNPEQTIVQLKNFEPPEALTNTLAVGNAGAAAIKVVSALGGKTNIKTTGTGGKGGPLTLKSGEGGNAAEAATSSTGGEGGTFEIVSGFGGGGGVTGGVKSKGGAGGKLILSSGNGGASSEGSEVDTGGEGGLYELKAGKGGEAAGVTGSTHTGGNGGKFVIKAGEGGSAVEGTVTNTGGAGGAVEILAGKAGVGAGSTPKGGAFIIASGAGAAAAQNGAIEVKTGATLRAKVEPEGEIKVESKLKVKESFAVWAHALPASQHAEVTVPGVFKKGTFGFETEAEGTAAIKKLTEVIEILKEYGLTK